MDFAGLAHQEYTVLVGGEAGQHGLAELVDQGAHGALVHGPGPRLGDDGAVHVRVGAHGVFQDLGVTFLLILVDQIAHAPHFLAGQGEGLDIVEVLADAEHAGGEFHFGQLLALGLVVDD